ncbi:MAG TPA: TetR/AcrR family transcriptional regulator [Allosphingosinicella sp.]|jgi:AcrR family transcriptional regulator
MAKSGDKYHHGNLPGALVQAALSILDEGGAADLSVRAAARRAGVSSGAPFRHFASREALLAAVAGEALRRLRVGIEEATASAGEDPLARYEAIGIAYLAWAFANPTHFEIISTRGLLDREDAQGLREENGKLIEATEQALRDAAGAGRIESRDVQSILIAGRALVYGLARMRLDGHYPRWGVDPDAVDPAAAGALRLFIESIRRR